MKNGQTGNEVDETECKNECYFVRPKQRKHLGREGMGV
jgi:hypothetical protein